MAAVKGLYGSLDEFLKQCSQSGDSAYSAFRSLLERLENPETRTEARVFFAHLQKKLDSDGASQYCLDTYHFQIQDIYLERNEGYQKRKKLTMMVIPSIFMPEDWSFTFYEGLNRHPDSIFKDKIVAELGCGNGWISIAIAEKWLPLKVYGLDINPRAVKISWINLYLNAFDENGQPVYDHEKKTLLDRVEFYESDLLSYCRDNHIELERIVGCIPQILNPNPDAMSKLITENASEEFLHSLSNYCALQGFVEDQFGLGLIARAVEEGIDVIKPMGIMIFNMGGRPGQGVCKRLFERRGLRVNKLWQTKILQASDTDISALVEIEKNNPHRFEFFMGLVGDQPICARTAWAFGKAGGRISHALSVYSCQLRQPNQVKKIFQFLKNEFHDISNSLDLSFGDDSVADEKIPFLAYLAGVLKDNSRFPYEPPIGSKRFRDLIAGFMKTYHHVPLSADNVAVFPSRATAIENALRLFTPRLAIVDEHLTRHLPRQWLTSLEIEQKKDNRTSADEITVIEAPRQSDLMIELIKKLRPQVVVTGIAQFEAITSSAFEHLLRTTREIGSRLFIDISDQFELSSLPSSIGVLKYLARTPLPSHVVIICGLLRNQVYTDLEVAFVISEEKTIFDALSKSVELLQGNTALISQYYYGCLFHELLSFKLPDRHPPAERQVEDVKSSEMIGFSCSVISVLSQAELSVRETDKSALIHMDVDQIFLPTPTPVKAAIFESFARQNVTESECDVTPSIRQFIKDAYGFSADYSAEFIYADFPLALFNKMVLCCIEEGGSLCIPAGSNGNYVSAAKFLAAKIVSIPTQAETGFKLTEKQLTSVLETVSKPWVYISGPTINPTGLLYSNEEMKSLLTVCAKYGARVIIDTSFSGVEFNLKGWNGWNLDGILTKLTSSGKLSFSVCLLGGLFFKMPTGGLAYGFLVLNHRFLADAFHSFSGLNKPHSTIRYTAKKLLDLREQNVGDLTDAVEGQGKLLATRLNRLKETLKSCGWEVVEACGGVSVIAKPSAYLGKSFKLEKDGSTWEAKLNDTNIREAMLRATGLCINGASWTGIPGYCRFTLALEDGDFDRALDCIVKFRQVVK
ncbi:methionine S-methyltransferase [Cynara cardunculus var. scolymus]|uniref:methionine S-methyltransferase n=1 Tax=Cynara cardunculus var. scolymus TaxID=59895 RepID=A0A124SAV0_CYNCS|nr:methionine S-methyltransferase [Cynara cardunculus var. scolymus]KVH88645.1 Aminotransferase, class I/classII [Cynara cardunculus var. scolymus]